MTLAVNIAQSGSNNVTFRNRIINGAMVIDQRNAGAAVTVNSGTDTFAVDRFPAAASGGGVFTMQRSTTSATNFSNSLLATVTTADSSIAAGDYYGIQHKIEGFNTADFNSGTANAKTITLSFWVRSSITGTYGLGLGNNANNRWYPASYAISSANTWEQKSITLTCDTSGTWDTTTGTGLWLWLDLGSGSTYQGTANAWTGSTKLTVTGATQWIATSGATFYITGVQLEAGTTASPFEYRQYGTELALCQRYFEILGSTQNTLLFQTYAGIAGTGTERTSVYYKILKRTTPTATVVGTWVFSNGSALAFGGVGVDCSRLDWSSSGVGSSFAYNNNTGAYLSFSAEL